MKAIIACEYSGLVREAFAAKGWDATSCDLLPTEIPGKHYQGNILDIINNGYDLLIGFPPCQFMTSSGLFRCRVDKYGEKALDRIKKKHEAVEFFFQLWFSNIKHISLENPTGYISSSIFKPTQIIHPYYFGEKQLKRTCLWLKNLPPLVHSPGDLFTQRTHSDYPEPSSVDVKTGKKRYFTDSLSGGEFKTAHQRNKTFQSIANAMAEQWTEYILNK